MPNRAVHASDGQRLGSAGSTSTNLIQLVKNHDQEAWRVLLDLYVPLVYSWCRRSDMQAQDAADVVQEVFRAVFGGIARFRHDRPGDTFRGWLRTIARNKIRDHFSRRAGRPVALGGTDPQQRFMEVTADESQTSFDTNPLAGLMHRALSLIRAEFEDRTWQAFWLAAVQQESSTDIARQLGMTSAAVRQAKCRVLRRLRQELGDLE